MASLKMLDAAAAEAGFVHTDCVHESKRLHLVYDYPQALTRTRTGPVWRVHTDLAKVPHVTYISWTDLLAPKGYVEQRVSLVGAIDFMRRVAREHPKEG